MSFETLKNRLPDFAKDLKLNISSLLNETILTDQQKYGVFLAAALAGQNATVIQDVMADANEYLSDDAITAVKTAHALMGMNNVYYRHLSSLTNDKELQTMPAGLRMNALTAHGNIEKADFEAYELAVSTIYACKMCVQAHESGLLKEGFSKQQIQAIIRISAVVHAVSVTLESEAALGNEAALSAAA